MTSKLDYLKRKEICLLEDSDGGEMYIRLPLQMCFTIHIFLTLICSSISLFQWLEFDDRFDCVVGISVDDKPVGVGVFFSFTQILTSANPLQDYLSKDGRKNITVHAIDGKYDSETGYEVNCIIAPYFYNRKDLDWVGHGTNGTHSPLFDLLVITLEQTINVTNYDKALTKRKPFNTRLASPNFTTVHYGREWSFASFGYIDKQHIEDSFEMEAEFMNRDVFENCDEWIPREWGLFICLSLDEDYKGIQSGTPLFHNNKLFGIGSFSIKKMNRTAFVFTDVRPYFYNLGYCETVNDTDELKLWSRWSEGGYWPEARKRSRTKNTANNP